MKAFERDVQIVHWSNTSPWPSPWGPFYLFPKTPPTAPSLLLSLINPNLGHKPEGPPSYQPHSPEPNPASTQRLITSQGPTACQEKYSLWGSSPVEEDSSRYTFHLPLFFLKKWNIVDVLCFTAKQLSYAKIFFFRIFFIMGYYKILTTVPCGIAGPYLF